MSAQGIVNSGIESGGCRVRWLTETEEEDDGNWVDIGGPGYDKLLETHHQI
ncbi:hypothetical protein ES705_33654 [subsurface metagenome]